jgi:hypothetical protein
MLVLSLCWILSYENMHSRVRLSRWFLFTMHPFFQLDLTFRDLLQTYSLMGDVGLAVYGRGRPLVGGIEIPSPNVLCPGSKSYSQDALSG